jgi:tetratricopeptide (TPR) repeat protein
MNCTRCGAANRAGATFCTQCGQALPAKPVAPAQAAFCTQCGAPVGASARFCPSCGQPVRGARAAPAVAPPARPAQAPPDPTVGQELAQLGLPANYGLPAHRGQAAAVSYLRTGVALGHAQVRMGMTQQAIETTTQLLGDRAMQGLGYKPLMAAAYYVRGLALEKQGNRAAARIEYQNALRLSKIPLAQAALKRVK